MEVKEVGLGGLCTGHGRPMVDPTPRGKPALVALTEGLGPQDRGGTMGSQSWREALGHGPSPQAACQNHVVP